MVASEARAEQPRYGTWIRTGRLRTVVALAAACGVGSLLGVRWVGFWLLLAPAAVFGYIAVVLTLTARSLGRQGLQGRIHGLVAREVVGGGGQILDVGCGSGALAIAIAKADPRATVVGMDTWGEDWEYSRSQCEENARLEGVAERVRFERASAVALPLPDAGVDAVVSCLTFHEVKECEDRTDALSEALRVLRPGGRFAFLDLFSDPASFTSTQHVLEAIARSGCAVAGDEPLAALVPLPYPLAGRRVLGYARLVTGARPAE